MMELNIMVTDLEGSVPEPILVFSKHSVEKTLSNMLTHQCHSNWA